MEPLRVRSASEQVADYLKRELLRGRMTGVMPGEDRLMAQLGVGRNTIKAALQHLEDEGLLKNQGAGRRRLIVLPERGVRRELRVRILLYEGEDRGLIYNARLLARLQEAGFDADFATKSLHDLGMRVERVSRFVAKTPADAWIISAGSREILEWFFGQAVPSIAMFGRFLGLPIAASCPEKKPAMITAVRRLVELGHRRIVMVSREERRLPQPAVFEQAFLDELDAFGIRTGSYNLPRWSETREGFHDFLESLFHYTPPSAVIIQEAPLFAAARLHLADRGIVAPRDVSMICDGPDPGFAWCEPVVSHIRWDYRPVVRRVVRWADNVAKGKDDQRQYLAKTEFVEGGTIGPVPKGR